MTKRTTWTSLTTLRDYLTDAAVVVGAGFAKRRRNARARAVSRAGWKGLESLEQRSLLAASPLAPEAQVDSSLVTNQALPAVATATNGDFVVVFQGADSGGADVFARQFNADGTPKGETLQVNPTVAADGSQVSVASDDAGDFVITWTSGETNDKDIYARIFSAAGAPTTGEFLVNSDTAGSQMHPSVGMDSDGDFVIGWVEETEVDFRRFGADGTPAGDDSKASDSTPGAKDTITYANAAVAVDADGDFVVGWGETKTTVTTTKIDASYSVPEYDDNGKFTGYTIVPYFYDADIDKLASANVNIKRYNASGTQQGGTIAAFSSTVVGKTIDDVKVAIDSSGDFVVGYRLGLYDNKHDPFFPSVYYPQPTGSEVWSRRFTASGTGATAQRAAGATLPTSVTGFGVDIDNSGGVTVVWATSDDQFATTLQAVRYDSASNVDGPVFPLNSTITSSLANPAVSLLDNGNIVFAFEGAVSIDIDIYFRRFEPSKPNLSATFGDIKVGKSGTSAFATTLIPGDQVTMGIRVTNGPTSALAVDTTTNINVYASSDHTLGGDILLGTLLNQKLTLAIGASATFNFSWIVGSTTPPDAYRLYAVVDSAGTLLETTEDDNTADAGNDVNVGWDFGNIGGRNAKLVLPDGDGTVVTYTLKGTGSGSLDTSGNLTLTGTNSVTTVAIAAKKGKVPGDNGTSNINNVEVNGSLKSLTGKTTFLKGNFHTNGTISLLSVKGAGTSGAAHTIKIDGASAPVSMTLGDVVDMGLTSNAPINKLAANSWTATGAAPTWHLNAPVASIGIKGVATFNLRATADIKTIFVGQLLNSHVLAGVDIEELGLPDSLADFTGANTIGSFSVKGIAGQAFAFINSIVAAKTITKIQLKQVNLASGPGPGTIGVAADELKSYKRDNVGLSNATTPGDLDVNDTYKVHIV